MFERIPGLALKCLGVRVAAAQTDALCWPNQKTQGGNNFQGEGNPLSCTLNQILVQVPKARFVDAKICVIENLQAKQT